MCRIAYPGQSRQQFHKQIESKWSGTWQIPHLMIRRTFCNVQHNRVESSGYLVGKGPIRFFYMVPNNVSAKSAILFGIMVELGSPGI
jgi:hypothetical protein